MSLEEDIQILRNVEMFSDFNDEHLRLIAFGSEKMSFANNHELYRQGQSSSGGYIIISGNVELLNFKDGQSKTLGVFGPGSLLGEIALISMNERFGTAIVRSDCELMKVSRTVMHRILNEYPELAVALHKKISASILKFAKDLEQVRL